VSQEVYNNIVIECLYECGGNYGSAQNVGIAMVDIGNKIGWKVDNPFRKGRICSELIYAVAFKDIIPELDYDENTIKPHEIEDIINKHYVEIDNVYKLKVEK